MNDPRLTMNGMRAIVAVLPAGACGTAAAHHSWLTVESAPEGGASVPLDRPGAWMVRAGTREPYPEPATCDEVKYSVSLTFTVR